MKKSIKIVITLAVLVVAAGVLGKNFNKKEEPKAVKRPSFAGMAVPVEVSEVSRGVIEVTINATGDVEAENQVDVYSKVEGRIVELNVKRGDRVKKGQLLARVEDDALKARLAEAEAALEVARARWTQMEAGLRPQEREQARDVVQKAQAEFSNAELSLARARELFEKGFISPQQLDEAELKYASARAFLNTAQEKMKMAEEGYRAEDRQASLAQVHQAEANLRMAEIRLAESRITAPIEGIVDERMVDAGAFVRASTGILSIVDMDRVKVLINIAEKDIPRIRRGQRAQVVVDAYPDQKFRGEVEDISPVVDRESRTAEVKILVVNKEHRLKPGMFARVKMIVARRENSLLVGTDSIVSGDGRAYLFVNENGRARKRAVKLGLRDGEKVEVLDNLSEGEQVVSAGLNRLKDNSSIKVTRVRSGK